MINSRFSTILIYVIVELFHKVNKIYKIMAILNCNRYSFRDYSNSSQQIIEKIKIRVLSKWIWVSFLQWLEEDKWPQGLITEENLILLKLIKDFKLMIIKVRGIKVSDKIFDKAKATLTDFIKPQNKLVKFAFSSSLPQ